MANVDLSAGKTAVNTLKEAQNIGKQLGSVVTDQQADMERAVQEQHRKRMQTKAQQELMRASQDFRLKKEHDEEMKFMDSDRYKMTRVFWWCLTVAALVTYFFKLYK